MQGRRVKTSGTPAGEPVCCAGSAGIFPGHDAVACGTADRVGGIAVSESHATGSELVNIGRFVEGVRIVGSYVHVAEVINQEENNVRLGMTCRQKGNKEGG